jgi:hypothetical protein
MRKLMDGDLRQRMGAAARAFVEQNRLEEPFSAILDSEGYRQRIKKNRKLELVDGGQSDGEADGEAGSAPESVDSYLLDHRIVPSKVSTA